MSPPPPSPCRAEGDELHHRARRTAERRADEEDHHRRLQHALAAVEVAELAVERGHHGLGEQVGGDDPRQPLETAELADDGGQRRGDDRRVERGEQQHEQQAAEDDEAAGLGDDGGRGFARGDVGGRLERLHQPRPPVRGKLTSEGSLPVGRRAATALPPRNRPASWR
jgi:hypothetical protein